MKKFVGRILITPHAKQRFIERRLNVTVNENRYVNVYKKMIGMIQRSELIKCLRKADSRLHEYREYAGCIFVCHREYSKEFFKQDLVTIITVELTTGFIKTTLEKGYNIDGLVLNSYTLDKIN